MKNLSVNSKKIISCVEKGIAMVLCVTTLGAFASCSSKSTENEKTKTGVEDQLDYIKDAQKRSEIFKNTGIPYVGFLNLYDIVKKTTNSKGDKLYIVSLKSDKKTVGLFNDTTQTLEIPCGKYDEIGREFERNGQTYRKVSVPGDYLYVHGWYNMETFKEDVPCQKYDYISERDFQSNGKNYRYVSVPGDLLYESGWLNMDTFEEDIPCKKYNFISEKDFQSDGKNYRYVGVPGDTIYESGWLNMETFNEDIPCKTYVDSEVVNIDDIDYYTFKDKEGKEKVYSLKK